MHQDIFKVLERLEEVPGRRERFWNVPRETGNFLNMLVRASGAGRVLEIGTSNGYSGLWFAEALSHTGGKLYTVESHRERFEAARKNFEEAGAESVVWQIFGHAPEIFSHPDFLNLMEKDGGAGEFDLIFLDATKMEYGSYLDAVEPFLRKDGLLVADNVISHRNELENFLAEVQKKREFRSVTLPLGSGLLFALKLS
jgi:predicted O-methyltransferase YrrM